MIKMFDTEDRMETKRKVDSYIADLEEVKLHLIEIRMTYLRVGMVDKTRLELELRTFAAFLDELNGRVSKWS